MEETQLEIENWQLKCRVKSLETQWRQTKKAIKMGYCPVCLYIHTVRHLGPIPYFPKLKKHMDDRHKQYNRKVKRS